MVGLATGDKSGIKRLTGTCTAADHRPQLAPAIDRLIASVRFGAGRLRLRRSLLRPVPDTA